MSFRGKTIEIAIQELQKAAIPHLHKVAHFGGADTAQGRDKDWKVIRREDGGNLWAISWERDRFLFAPTMFQKIVVESGPLTPTGEMKNDYAIQQNITNGGERDMTADIDYQRGETIHLESEETDTIGLSNTSFIEGQIGGGETSGGSYVKAGTSITITGEIAKRMQEASDNSQLITLHGGVVIPPHSAGYIQQLIQSGPGRVTIVRKNVVDLGWSYIDWKKRKRDGFIRDNKDWKGWGSTKSRTMWVVDDLADWELLASGNHPDYPHSANLTHNSDFREAYDYLADPDNRTIEVTSVAVFEKSIYGDLSFTPV